MDTKKISAASRIDPAIKKQWLERLLNGQYLQGKRALRSLSNEYCCLGVLATCLVQPSDWKLLTAGVAYCLDDGGVEEPLYLPKHIADQCGIDETAQGQLAAKNDGGWTFKMIASWIEREL